MRLSLSFLSHTFSWNPDFFNNLKMHGRRVYLIFFLLFILFLFILFFNLSTGSTPISFSELISTLLSSESVNDNYKQVLLDFRFPKAIAAIFAGAGLSVSGLLMQTVFRNQLAGPDVLGVTSGASLGVALSVLGTSAFFATGAENFAGNFTMAISACFGAAAVMLLIFIVSARVKSITTILILGVLLSSIIMSVVSILQYFSPSSSLKVFMLWTMGSLGGVTKSQLFVLVPIVSVGLIISIFLIKQLNILYLGETFSRSLGVNVKTIRFLAFLSTSIMAGVITAFCGPLAFVGIAVPHICRLMFSSSDHRVLLPSSIIAGATILLASDVLSQLDNGNTILPINSVTALIGIPIIMWIIFRNKRLE